MEARERGEREKDRVFMEDNFPPQKAVIGINYLTGANSDESHN